MLRILGLGGMFVIAPLHMGMACQRCQPGAAAQEGVVLGYAGAVIWFVIVATRLQPTTDLATWSAARKAALRFYVAPLAVLGGVRVGVEAYRENLPATDQPRLEHLLVHHLERPKGTVAFPPDTPSPFVVPVAVLFWRWLVTTACLVGAVTVATPLWLWLLALAVGLWRAQGPRKA